MQRPQEWIVLPPQRKQYPTKSDISRLLFLVSCFAKLECCVQSSREVPEREMTRQSLPCWIPGNYLTREFSELMRVFLIRISKPKQEFHMHIGKVRRCTNEPHQALQHRSTARYSRKKVRKQKSRRLHVLPQSSAKEIVCLRHARQGDRSRPPELQYAGHRKLAVMRNKMSK